MCGNQHLKPNPSFPGTSAIVKSARETASWGGLVFKCQRKERTPHIPLDAVDKGPISGLVAKT